MINKWLTILLAVGLGLLAWGAHDDIDRALRATQPAKTVTVNGYGRAIVEFSEAVVHASIPTTNALQAKGLAGRTHLTDTDGMLWLYPVDGYPSFWMKDMAIPIDIIWIRGQSVIDVSPNLPVPTADNPELPIYSPKEPADPVLETADGFAERKGVDIGDRVTIDRQ